MTTRPISICLSSLVTGSILTVASLPAKAITFRIMPIGDSLTQGFVGLDTATDFFEENSSLQTRTRINEPDGDTGYRDNLLRLLQINGFSDAGFVGNEIDGGDGLFNNAFPGKDISSILDEIEQGALLTNLAKLRPNGEKPNIVLLQAGTNENLSSSQSINSAVEDFKKLTTKISNDLPDSYIFVSSIPEERSLTQNNDEFNRRIQEFAISEDRVYFVNAGGLFKREDLYDSRHPRVIEPIDSLIPNSVLSEIEEKNAIIDSENVPDDFEFIGSIDLNQNLPSENDPYQRVAQSWFNAIDALEPVLASSSTQKAGLYEIEAAVGSINILGHIKYDGPFGKFTDEGILNDNATWNIFFSGQDIISGQERDFGFRLESGTSTWEFDIADGGSGGLSFFEVTPDEFIFNASSFTNLVGEPLGAFGPIADASQVDFSFFGPAFGSVGFELFATSGASVSTTREPFSELKTSGNVSFKPVPEPGSILGLITVTGLGLFGMKRKLAQADECLHV